jgi:hypothetical protein
MGSQRRGPSARALDPLRTARPGYRKRPVRQLQLSTLQIVVGVHGLWSMGTHVTLPLARHRSTAPDTQVAADKPVVEA